MNTLVFDNAKVEKNMNNSNFAKILIITRFVNYIMHLIPFIGHFNQL